MDNVSNVIALAQNPDSGSSQRFPDQLNTFVAMIHRQLDDIRDRQEPLAREEVGVVLEETVAKIASVTFLNRRLMNSLSDGQIDLCEVLFGGLDKMVAAIALDKQVYVVRKVCGECFVSVEQASVLVQILCKIAMNAVKYVHPTDGPVQIYIDCEHLRSGGIALDVAADGVGFPEGANETRDANLGLELVRTLARRIGAALQIESSGLGLNFRLELPAESAQQ